MRYIVLTLSLLLIAACGGPKRVPVSDLVGSAPTAQPKKESEKAREPEKPKDPPKKVWTKRVVITTGVHGNEPSGYLVQDILVELGFVTFGPCNEWGIKNNKREMEDGRDLNRLFQDGKVPQVKAVWDFLEKNPPDLLLDLHEDPTGNAKGPYLIQNGPKDDLGDKIIEALKEYSWDPEPSWGPVKGKNGLIKPTAQMLALQKLANVFSLGSYAFFKYKVTTFTVEVPGDWDMEKKKAYQLKVCQTAREIFEARQK